MYIPKYGIELKILFEMAFQRKFEKKKPKSFACSLKAIIAKWDV